MSDSNFTFMVVSRPILAELGKQAETYVYSDPQSAVVKLRCFAELFVGIIYQELSLSSIGLTNLYEKLEHPAFVDVVEDCVVKKLHAVRMKGNKAAHMDGVSVSEALWLVKETFFLGAWLNVAQDSGVIEDLPKYLAPQPAKAQQETILREKAYLEKALLLQTAELHAAKQELALTKSEQIKALAKFDGLDQSFNTVKAEASKRLGREVVECIDFEIEETISRINIFDAFSEYKLTDGQQELVASLDTFLRSNDDKVFLLRGYAGTGKTFITKGLTEYFRAIGRNYVLAAPTGKAAKVIANKTRSVAYTLHKVIYSFSNLKEYIEESVKGSQTYKFYFDLKVNDGSVDTVYIVDESSMISDVYNEQEFHRCGSGHLLRDFLKFVNLDHNDHRKKLILIGDDAQLPPVGMKESPALNPKYLRREYGLNSIDYELTEVLRQKADSGVMHNAIAMRKSMKEGVYNQLDFDMGHPDLEHVDYAELIARYLQTCDNKINGESIIIAHSNADVAAYNTRVREEFFPNCPEICAGDKVMVVANNDANGFLISNGDFGQVRQVLGVTEHREVTIKRKSEATGDVEKILVLLRFRDVKVGFRDLEGNTHFFVSKIIENLLYSNNPSLSSDESKAIYLDFCIRNGKLKPGTKEFIDALRSDLYFNALQLKFGYAITCHKAQGSEWNHVFVKCKTHQNQLCTEYFRWLYTAITRTANRLYLLDEPHIKLGSGIKVINSPGRVAPLTAVPQPKPPKIPHIDSIVGDLNSTNVVMPIAQSVTVESGESFGISQDNTFLLSLLREVRERLIANNIEIYDIHHQQYQEAYFFSRETEGARINISYKSNQKVSALTTPQPSKLTDELFDLLNSLKGQVIFRESASSSIELEFSEPFINEFHQRLLNATSAEEMIISNVEEKQYSLRYWFQKSGHTAVIDIYYTKNKRFSSCDARRAMSTSDDLVDEALSIISEGFD